MTNPTYRPVTIPALASFGEDNLIEATADGLTSGLCATREEAEARITALVNGAQPETQAPDGQANEREMGEALAYVRSVGIRDGGFCRDAIEAAIKAGLHTVEWAVASRYLVAGWVPMRG